MNKLDFFFKNTRIVDTGGLQAIKYIKNEAGTDVKVKFYNANTNSYTIINPVERNPYNNQNIYKNAAEK